MAVILVATDDAETVSILAPTLESLGHTALLLFSTENIVEDVVLNDAAMVLISEDTLPYSGWESCALLRADPTVPKEMSVLMLTEGSGNVRLLEKFGFSGTVDPAASCGELGEVLTRQLGDLAAPEEPPRPKRS